jgi:hypothetical protein
MNGKGIRKKGKQRDNEQQFIGRWLDDDEPAGSDKQPERGVLQLAKRKSRAGGRRGCCRGTQ